ncbi:MAG TPA: cytochrome c oxidase subunit II [Rhizomicrobium sp.]|jgi:cytochrome c oxidase subunit 2|nr:cytochrome c oxidase subunit II [Rhizomicrobium sp.]
MPTKLGMKIWAAIVGATVPLTATGAWAAGGEPKPWQIDFQPAASPVMENIEDFHRLLVWIITAISLFVLALLVWIMIRYNHRANPRPSKTEHNTLLEVAWTVVPVIILVIIAIPSFKLLYYEAEIPKPDLTIEAIGKQWFWSYQYPNQKFQFDSLGLSDVDALKRHEPRLLGVDNIIVVPVNKVVKVVTTGADVIHSWTVPAFGVKMDAVPGRLNETWFKATQTGTFYGQCSELCGARHAFMPIEVKVVSQPEFDAWVSGAKKKFAAIDKNTRFAALTQ